MCHHYKKVVTEKIEKKTELSHFKMKCLKDISSINRMKGIDASEIIRKKNRRINVLIPPTIDNSGWRGIYLGRDNR